ncbi:nucleotidyltransferase domain-containing protein [Dyadobacter sp. 32]|uniref:nucleotidyltransferase family protein n=1 Tax=Dyadobacter sp. 32 TaxID=538966 RepID=UPI0011EF8900
MEEIVKKLASYFLTRPIKKAFIFGSIARNESHAKSDVDILVDLDYEGGADFFIFMEMQEELSELLGTKVDLVSSNGLSSFLKPFIDQDKKLIYEKV